MLGVGLGPIVQVFSQFQQTFWPQDPDKARMTAELFLPAIQAHPVLVPLAVGVLAGFCEEMLFRGALQTPLQRRLPAWAAIGITAVLFGAFHFDLNGLPIRAGLGFLLGWLAWRGKSIFPAMLAHGLYDTTVLALVSWQVHHHGPASVTRAPGAGLQFTRADLMAVGAGVLLVLVAIALLRAALRRDAAGSLATRDAINPNI
jgi:membrane protease YdiL (CAAX protease family)